MLIEPLACDLCGAEEWFAVAPGSEAEQQKDGNLVILKPAPAEAAKCWCLACWPWGPVSAEIGQLD